jgi:hypothetical protein
MKRRRQNLFLQLIGFVCQAVAADAWAQRSSRRAWLQRLGRDALAAAAAMGAIGVPTPAAKAANLPQSYAPSGSEPGSLASLRPVVRLEHDLQEWQRDLRALAQKRTPNDGSRSWPALPPSLPTNEGSFKSIFDAYSVPVSYKQKWMDSNAFLVYYTQGYDGPGRPSMETDLNEIQTQQYGYRNEAWVAWEDVLAEYKYASLHAEDYDSFDDLELGVRRTLQALTDYLALAPPTDVAKAISW